MSSGYNCQPGAVVSSSNALTFSRVTLILFASREVRKGEFYFGRLRVPPPSSLRSGRTFLTNGAVCYRWENSFFIPDLVVGLILMELLVQGGIGTTSIPSRWPIFPHLFEGSRERQTTEPWKAHETPAGRGNSSLASIGAP